MWIVCENHSFVLHTDSNQTQAVIKSDFCLDGAQAVIRKAEYVLP